MCAAYSFGGAGEKMRVWEKLGAVWNGWKRAVSRYDDTHNFTCDICGREVFGGERVCAPCNGALPWNNGAMCPFCGRRTGEPGACLDCKEKPLAVEKARSVFTHEGEAARLVLRFKNGGKYLFRTAAELLFPLIGREFSQADTVAFVPMTKKDEKKRGYNQSRLLAERLSEQSRLPLLNAAIKRKQTSPQKSLGRKEREKNLEGCFHITDRKGVKDKSILIIDDTLTTGATASALADAFKRAGAKTVFLLTLTSVQKKNPFGIPPEEENKQRA